MSAVSRYYTELSSAPRAARLRKPKRAFKINWALFVVSFVVLSIVLMLIVYLCNCAQLVDIQYRISDLRENRDQLSREIDFLDLKVQNLQSFERLQWEAERRLGMCKPADSLVLNISTQPVAVSAGNRVAMDKSF
ncbi:MAG: hypothetical protein ABIH00_02535 [Armatimonadota bacterium]